MLNDLMHEEELSGWQVAGNTFVYELSERNMDVQERALMQAAKRAELQSFFDNRVWVYTDTHDPARTLKARFLLKWRTGEQGQLEAKARLVL